MTKEQVTEELSRVVPQEQVVRTCWIGLEPQDGILSNVFLLTCLESLILFSQVSESAWNFQTKYFLMFSSLACYPCSAEVAGSAVPNLPNINNVNQVKDLVTSCTNPYSASEGAHHRDVTFSVGDCFCYSWVQFVKNTKSCPGSHAVVVCTEWDEFKTLDWEKVPADYPPLNVVRKRHHIFRSSYDIHSSNFCVPMLSMYKFMENTSRYMRQWWNQPLCLMVRHFIKRCLLFLDLAK